MDGWINKGISILEIYHYELFSYISNIFIWPSIFSYKFYISYNWWVLDKINMLNEVTSLSMSLMIILIINLSRTHSQTYRILSLYHLFKNISVWPK